jgi:hypothetical protein
VEGDLDIKKSKSPESIVLITETSPQNNLKKKKFKRQFIPI